MVEIMQQPGNPDVLARKAGKDIYGTAVGMLRRVELWRLANAWGMKFPDGATKDHMLPFFKQLEAEGKDPLRPPSGASLESVVSARAVEHTKDNHSEFIPNAPDGSVAINPADGKPWRIAEGRFWKPVDLPPPPPDQIQPAPISDFEMKLLKTPQAQLKKMCKLRGIPQGRQDTKQTLVARILAHAKGIETDDHRVNPK